MNEVELLEKMLHEMAIPAERQKLKTLIRFRDELLRWNRKINLTAIRCPEEVLEKHLVDSLTLTPFIFPDSRLLDMGSGGGFPGIPLKIMLPSLKVCSVDAAGKKIAFQKHVARLLRLKDFDARHERLEDMAHFREKVSYDVIVTRAFASLPEILALAEPLLATQGQLIAMKGAEGVREWEETKNMPGVMQRFGFRHMEILSLPISKARRVLLFFSKKRPDNVKKT